MKRLGSLLGVLALVVGMGWVLGDTQAQEQTPNATQRPGLFPELLQSPGLTSKGDFDA